MAQELTANTTLSHYRIVSRTGASGMGEVFLAHDTKLERPSISNCSVKNSLKQIDSTQPYQNVGADNEYTLS
jgi:hypothetical protein